MPQVGRGVRVQLRMPDKWAKEKLESEKLKLQLALHPVFWFTH
jgi:hypothetical protein